MILLLQESCLKMAQNAAFIVYVQAAASAAFLAPIPLLFKTVLLEKTNQDKTLHYHYPTLGKVCPVELPVLIEGAEGRSKKSFRPCYQNMLLFQTFKEV